MVGSGAAGLAAAVAAAAAGADVVVAESSATLGGTSAMSGGVVWAPGHGVGGDPRPPGDDEAALGYLCGVGGGGVDVELCRTFVGQAGPVVAELEASTALRWEVLAHWPDYRPDVAGACDGGRSIWPAPLTVPVAVAARLGPPSGGTDGEQAPAASTPADDGVVLRGALRGRTLVAALVAAALDAGVEIRAGCRVGALAVDGDAVRGVEVGDETLEGRVVLATGGFQHCAPLVSAFLPAAPVVPLGAPGCDGDGLRMSLAVHADVGSMPEGWWMPAMHVPGETFGGAAWYRPLHSERAQPGAILVDRAGRRFADEAQNYGDVGRAMQRFVPGVGFDAAPCWLVFDAAYRGRYPVGPLRPVDPDPPWLERGEDLAELASRTGMAVGVLHHTVERFNDSAAKGEDPDFARGSSAYDRWIGDPSAPHPTLGPLRQAPYYALAVHLGCIGTKGGPRTDGAGRVLRAGRPVRGLYAAGNAAASPFGTATAAGGATLGPALVFGTLAGRAAARDDGRAP